MSPLKDLSRRRRRPLRKRQNDDQDQKEDGNTTSSSSSAPEAEATGQGDEGSQGDETKEGESPEGEPEPSPTDDSKPEEEKPSDDPESSPPPVPSQPAPAEPEPEEEPTPTSIVEPSITETPAIFQTPGPETHDESEYSMLLSMGTSLHQAAASYDAQGFKSNAEVYNKWAASMDSSISMVKQYLETVAPEEDEEPSTTSSEEEQPPTSTEEEYASTKTIRPTQQSVSEPKEDEGFKLPFSTGVAVAIGVGVVAVIVLIILMIWRPCCRRNLNGKDRRLKPPKTIKEMLYENDVPVAAPRSPDRTPLRSSGPVNVPAVAPMMQQSAALTQASSGAAGIGARSRFANAFRKITGSSAPGGGMDESTYGEVIDLPSISSSKSSLQDVRPLPNTVQPGWAKGHVLQPSGNSTGFNNRSSGVPVSAVPTGGKLSNPYSATG